MQCPEVDVIVDVQDIVPLHVEKYASIPVGGPLLQIDPKTLDSLIPGGRALDE